MRLATAHRLNIAFHGFAMMVAASFVADSPSGFAAAYMGWCVWACARSGYLLTQLRAKHPKDAGAHQ